MDKQIMDAVASAVLKFQDKAIALSDFMAENPELSMKEFKASAKMTELLQSAGYDVETPYCGMETAFNAVYKNGAGPTAAILVEYDALPEIGHACGHNVHGAMSILAALALMDLKDKINGTLRIVGTPAEEKLGGKIFMADAGLFDDVDLAYMFHSQNRGINSPNMGFMAVQRYKVKFSGLTAHGAANPWEGRSALAAARSFMNLVDTRRQLFRHGAVVNMVVTDGGTLANIIPDRAEIGAEIRAMDKTCMEDTTDAFYKCAKAAGLAFDCPAEVIEEGSLFADLVPNDPAASAMAGIMRELGLSVTPPLPPDGSSDIGNVSYRCPAIHPVIAITDESCGFHMIDFAKTVTLPKAHEALVTGGKALALMALELFRDPELVKAIRADFEKRVQKTGR